MYELWRGTIESQDGALQILQIVDYIWSWARDVYRPQIRACLRSLVVQTNSVLVYPTDGHNYTPSVGSRYSQDPNALEDFGPSEDEEGEDEANPREDEDNENGDVRIPSDNESTTETLEPSSGPEDHTMTDQITFDMVDSRVCPTKPADSHHFLRWAPGSPHSENWTKSACIKHSNLVFFSFQMFFV